MKSIKKIMGIKYHGRGSYGDDGNGPCSVL